MQAESACGCDPGKHTAMDDFDHDGIADLLLDDGPGRVELLFPMYGYNPDDVCESGRGAVLGFFSRLPDGPYRRDRADKRGRSRSFREPMPHRAFVLLLAAGIACSTLPADRSPSPPPTPQVQPPPSTSDHGFAMYGALKSVMHQGDYAAKVSVQELLREPGGQGVGALEGLGGEITVADGVAWLSVPTADGDMETTRVEAGGPDAGVALLAFGRVSEWSARPLTSATPLPNLGARIEAAAEAAGLPTDRPIPFQVRGVLDSLTYHVIDGSKLPPGPSSHKAHQAAAVVRTHEGQAARLVGMWSRGHERVFTHMGETTHIHVTVDQPLGSGHVDAAVVAAGAELLLPKVHGAAP